MTVRELKESGIINKYNVVLFPIEYGCGIQWYGTLGEPKNYSGRPFELPKVILDATVIELQPYEYNEHTFKIMISDEEMRAIQDEMNRINLEESKK